MTFTVDSCIIIALANEFDFHHEKSAMPLVKREDSLVILITVMTEAISTYIRKFNKASRDIVDMLEKNLESSDFVSSFSPFLATIIDIPCFVYRSSQQLFLGHYSQ